MKVFLTLMLASLSSFAVVYEAKPLGELTELISATSFEHKEDGLIFGFFSIQSCLFVSEEVAILKNYCLPVNDYPAKGYTIISPRYGIIDLYQENLNSVLKRDILISTFPDVLKIYLAPPLNTSTIASLNEILEKLYKSNDPACWSTNFSNSTGEAIAKCSVENVLNFDLWAQETQSLTGDLNAWKNLLDGIESKLKK